MVEFNKTKVNSQISVLSIVTVLHIDMKDRLLRGESHDFPEIYYPIKGVHHPKIEGKVLEVAPGQLVIYGPNVFHGHKTPVRGIGGEVGIISFETEPPLPEEFLNRVITLTGKQNVELASIIQAALPLFETRPGRRGFFLKDHASLYTLQSVKNRLELFLLDLMHPGEDAAMSRINRITDYMMKHIGAAPQLSQISSDLGMSVSMLKRAVEQTYGMPPMAYYTKLKMEEAKRMLLETPMNVTEISQALGFSSIHYFSRLFKAKTGMSPSAYAEAYKK